MIINSHPILGYRRNGRPIFAIAGGAPTVEELRAQIDTIDARVAEITERMTALDTEAGDGDLQGEAASEWERLEADLGEQRATREAREVEARDLERSERLRESRAKWGSLQVGGKVDPFDGGDVRSLPKGVVRDKALTVLDSKEHTRHLDDDQRERVDRLLRSGATPNYDPSYVARLMLLTENAHYQRGWMKLMTQPNPVLLPEEARALNEAQEFRAMAGSIDTAGGYGVPVFIDPTIILTGQGSLNPFRKIARVETITTDEWRGVSSAGVTWSYDTEGSAVSDDSPTVAQPTVAVHEARGFVSFSSRVAQDYPGFAAEMSTLLASGYDELQAQVSATGTGSDQPFGIIPALDSNTNVEVVVTTDGAFGGVDINKAWKALPDRFKANATWLMNTGVGTEIATFGNGNNLSFLTVDLTGVVETIRKRPIEFSSYFPDFTGTTGASNLLVVGDFRNFLMVDRVGMSVELVPHLFDTTNNRPTGQRGWYATARNGSDSINDNAFRLLQNQ